MELLESLDPLHKSLWFIAIPTSLIFLIQTVMTFLGVDSSDGQAADFEGDLSVSDGPFQMFSLRNLINFLLGFSWTGLSFYYVISNKAILIGLSFFIGVLFVYLFFMVIRQVQKLAEDNSFQISNTINKNAEVYLTIPENMTGKGKIMISVNGAYHELDAMTENESIPSGAFVKIIHVKNGNILIVQSI